MWGPKMIAVLALLPFQGQAAPANPAVEISTPAIHGEQNFADATPNSLDKRRPVWKNLVCGLGPKQDWSPTDKDLALEVAERVRAWKGFPKVGGRSCKVIYSQVRSGLEFTLCNDNAHEIQLRGYADIADAVVRIANGCKFTGTINGVAPVGSTCVGQQFAEGNWNVIANGRVSLKYYKDWN